MPMEPMMMGVLMIMGMLQEILKMGLMAAGIYALIMFGKYRAK